MAIIPGVGGGNTEIAPKGLQAAVCNFVEDIGTHKNPFPNDKGEVRYNHQIVMGWELHKENEEGERYTIAQFFTCSMHKKANLRKLIHEWYGEDMSDEDAAKFDVESLIGQNITLNIVHKKKADGKTKAVVSSVAPYSGDADTELKPKSLDIPEWVIKKRAESEEMKGQTNDTADASNEDDLPF